MYIFYSITSHLILFSSETFDGSPRLDVKVKVAVPDTVAWTLPEITSLTPTPPRVLHIIVIVVCAGQYAQWPRGE
jgi:hypothetical protein